MLLICMYCSYDSVEKVRPLPALFLRLLMEAERGSLGWECNANQLTLKVKNNKDDISCSARGFFLSSKRVISQTQLNRDLQDDCGKSHFLVLK